MRSEIQNRSNEFKKKNFTDKQQKYQMINIIVHCQNNKKLYL